MVAFTGHAPTVAYPTLDAGTSRLRRWCWFWFGEYGCLPVSQSVDLPDDRFAADSSGGQVAGSFVFATAAATAASFTPADGTATGTNAVGGFGFCFDEDAGVPLGMPTVRIRVTTGGDQNPANLTISMPEGSDVPGTILVCIAAYDWGNISDPATPAGWTRFAFLNNIRAAGAPRRSQRRLRRPGGDARRAGTSRAEGRTDRPRRCARAARRAHHEAGQSPAPR